MDDVKARLAEVLADHVGKAGIIFDQKDTLAHDDPSIGVRSTTMPGHPWTTPRHPVRDFPALLRIQHIGGIGQRLRNAFARGFGEPDLLGAQALDCSTIDGRRGQERDRLSASALRLLLQRPQVGDGGLGDARKLGLLVRG
jgi:hypothetical protein